MSETTDATTLVDDLTATVPLLARDAIAAAAAASSLPGPEGLALTDRLRTIATEEMRNLERVAARIASLGGTVSGAIPSVEQPKEWRDAVEGLIRMQREALDAVVAAIPADADDAEGEATEHLLEHIAAHKRDAIELLERALR